MIRFLAVTHFIYFKLVSQKINMSLTKKKLVDIQHATLFRSQFTLFVKNASPEWIVLLGRKPLGKFKSCLQLWRPEKYQSHRETQLVQIHQEIRWYLGDETLLNHSNNNKPVSFEQSSPQEPIPNQITNQMTPH